MHFRMLRGCFRHKVLSTLNLTEDKYCFRVKVSGMEPMGIERVMGGAEGTFVFQISNHHLMNGNNELDDASWLIDEVKREYEPDPRLQWIGLY